MTLKMTVQGPGPSESPMARFDWDRAAGIWADAAEPAITAALRAKAPVAPVGGGAFARSIRSRRHASAGLMTLTFGSAVSYAPYVISPTMPHTIRPRTAHALHFTVEGGTAGVFAAKVDHPGTRGNPFVGEVLTSMRPVIQEMLLAAVAAVQGG